MSRPLFVRILLTLTLPALTACGLRALPAPVCPAAPNGKATTQAPVLVTTLKDRWHESWLASPAVADLDGNGTQEIVIARSGRLLVFHVDGTLAWQADVPGRIWATPLVGDFAGDARLEVVVAARESIFMFSAAGTSMPGFPVTWRDEIRSLAGGDVDGDGRPDIAAVTTSPLGSGTLRDIILVLRGDGTALPGFPPNTTGASGCTSACYVTGGYDQNVAVGLIDGDDRWDIFTGQDNAYLSWHQGDGSAFSASAIFETTATVLGIRFLHDYALAQQGWAPDESSSLQGHFTNSAPAIADVDGDGRNNLVVVGSVQNAAQTHRKLGVALWVLEPDGTRPPGWTEPFLVSAYLAGLEDFEGSNIVGMTNQVSVADLDPESPGLEMVFAGFDGQVHLVAADRTERWTYRYTMSADVLTAGVALADLSADGRPEVIFATYSPSEGSSALFILDAAGNHRTQVALPGRGAMSVPTVTDVNGDGELDLVINLKDGEDRVQSALVYRVPGSASGCQPWPTGRGNALRNGFVPPPL